MYGQIYHWMPYDSVADRFHTKKLCSRLSSSKVRFHTENCHFMRDTVLEVYLHSSHVKVNLYCFRNFSIKYYLLINRDKITCLTRLYNKILWPVCYFLSVPNNTVEYCCRNYLTDSTCCWMWPLIDCNPCGGRAGEGGAQKEKFAQWHHWTNSKQSVGCRRTTKYKHLIPAKIYHWMMLTRQQVPI